jgi:hypothetical protein
MYSLGLIIFVVSEMKAFEHFPIGSNVNLFPAVVAILDIRSAKNLNFIEDLPMIIPGQFGQNSSSLKPLGHLKPNCPGMII